MITSQKKLSGILILKYVYGAFKRKYNSFKEFRGTSRQLSPRLFSQRFNNDNVLHTDQDQWNGARLLSFKELNAKSTAGNKGVVEPG